MMLDADSCYDALTSRDRRFDGRFFVGVATTGIYCRPICPARTPRRENCAFFPSAAAAELAGFRPCLRCRPEKAPGLASVDAVGRLAAAACSAIEDGGLDQGGVDAVAARLGVTGRHLRRVFHAEFGVSPIQYAQTQRLLLAKRLLTDSALPVTTVALAAGFASVRRFNALFLQRYRLAPSDLRKRPNAQPEAGALQFELGYRPPLAWTALLAFLDHRAIAGVESVVAGEYRRTVALQDAAGRMHLGWLTVGHDPQRAVLHVKLAADLAGVVPMVLARIKRVFDVACHPLEISAHLGDLAAAHPGLRLPGAFEGFEAAVRAVLGQQITVRAATTLAGRFATTFGQPVLTPFADLACAFPAAARIAALDPSQIAALGIIRTRAVTIQLLAAAVSTGGLVLAPGADVPATLVRLRAIPGIGEWTAHYLAMRALGWPDAFPHTDFGVKKALGVDNPQQVLALAAPWQPWRAYAVMHLWQSLSEQT